MAIDPICGMTVDESTAISAKRDGETFYFCCEHCRRKFLAPNPATLPDGSTLVALASPASAPAAGTIYMCPMHPGVEQDNPGTCPKCGMALEQTLLTAAPEDDSELHEMTRRFWIAAALAV